MTLRVGDVVRFTEAALGAMHWRQAEHAGARLAQVAGYPYGHTEIAGIEWLTGPKGVSIESVASLERAEPTSEQRVLRDLLLEDGQEELAGRALHPPGDRKLRAMAAVWYFAARPVLARPVVQRMGFQPSGWNTEMWAYALAGVLDVPTAHGVVPDGWGVRAHMSRITECCCALPEDMGPPEPDAVLELAKELRSAAMRSESQRVGRQEREEVVVLFERGGV